MSAAPPDNDLQQGARSQRLLARALRPFTRVHPAEVATVSMMTLAAFLLLAAYYLLKTVREPLILLEGGAEVKLYARAAQALIMVGVVHVYGELARRFGRMKLLTLVFLFFISNLVLFAVLAETRLHFGLAFFLWVGVFSYTVVAQFWALAADIYTAEQGKRLFPIIGGGSSVGALAGSRLASWLVPLGPQALMEAAVVILLVCVGLIVWIQRRAAHRGPEQAAAVREEPISESGAFALLIRDKYLLLIAGMVVFLNWVNSSGEYLLDRVLLKAAAEASASGASAARLHRGVQGGLLRLVQPDRDAPAAVRGLADPAPRGSPQGAALPAGVRPGRLRRSGGVPGPGGRPPGQDRGELVAVLPAGHHTARALPGRLARGEVRGQDRRGHGRRPARRDHVHGDGPAGHSPRLVDGDFRRDQCRAGDALDRVRARDCPGAPPSERRSRPARSRPQGRAGAAPACPAASSRYPWKQGGRSHAGLTDQCLTTGARSARRRAAGGRLRRRRAGGRHERARAGRTLARCGAAHRDGGALRGERAAPVPHGLGVPRPVDDPGQRRGARPLARGGRPAAGRQAGRPADQDPRARRP